MVCFGEGLDAISLFLFKDPRGFIYKMLTTHYHLEIDKTGGEQEYRFS